MSANAPDHKKVREGAPTAMLAVLALPALVIGALVYFFHQGSPTPTNDLRSPEKAAATDPGPGAKWSPILDGRSVAPDNVTEPPAPYVDLADFEGPLPSPPEDKTANMVLIPAGKFLFGELNKEVDLPAYFIDRYEVSQQEYAQFLRYVRERGDHSHCNPQEPANKDHTPLNWGRPDITDPRFPVVGLDYWDVYAYAGWVGKRLPTEQEWEKAARGTDGQEYPWGDVWDERLCNLGPTPGNPRTLLPVDSMPEGQSPFGCFHMLGNAAEWTGSFIDEARGLHCGRGYCWRIGHLVPYRTTYRMPGKMNLRDEGSGLRCAFDAEENDQAGIGE